MRSGDLSSTAARALTAADLVLLPAVALWEVAMLVEKGRIPTRGTVRDFFATAIVPGRIELAPLTPAIAARSSELGARMHGDPADRLIAATALELSLPLVTRDRRMSAIPGLQTVW